ncbi:MAG: M48 family metalloprotease, partial [bacterium]|nr:M48 family metalloprotease [bacterium]
MPVRVFVLLLVGLTLGAQDRPIGRGVNFYSKEKEAALGARLAAEIREKVTTLENAKVSKYVERLGGQLAGHMPGEGYDYTFTVYSRDALGRRNPTHEPCSVVGGHVLVPASLILAARDEAEFAGMLAHSMAHVAARHGTRTATRAEIVKLAGIPLVFSG